MCSTTFLIGACPLVSLKMWSDSLAKCGSMFPEFQKSLKAACDSKGDKKNRTRKLSAKWKVGRLWLQHDHDKGKICEWCIKNKQTLVAQNVLNSTRFSESQFRITRRAQCIFWHSKLCHRANLPKKKPSKSTIPDKKVGTRSKFSPPPTFNVDNQVNFALFVGKNALFSNID